MVRPLKEWEIEAYERAQQVTIRRRTRYLYDSRPTQQKIVNLLVQMDDLIQRKDQWEAQKYFFKVTFRHLKKPDHVDKNGVDWDEVQNQILHSCFSDSDMEGYKIEPRRVESELTAFRALMGLPQPVKEDF